MALTPRSARPRGPGRRSGCAPTGCALARPRPPAPSLRGACVGWWFPCSPTSRPSTIGWPDVRAPSSRPSWACARSPRRGSPCPSRPRCCPYGSRTWRPWCAWPTAPCPPSPATGSTSPGQSSPRPSPRPPGASRGGPCPGPWPRAGSWGSPRPSMSLTRSRCACWAMTRTPRRSTALTRGGRRGHARASPTAPTARAAPYGSSAWG